MQANAVCVVAWLFDGLACLVARGSWYRFTKGEPPLDGRTVCSQPGYPLGPECQLSVPRFL